MILQYQPSTAFTGWDMLTALPPSAQDVLPECRCGMSGLTMDGTGLLGTGLFSGGMDLSTWGAGEAITVGLGLYVLYAVFATGRSHAARVSRGYKRIRKKVSA